MTLEKLTELQGRNTSFTDRERPYLTAHVVFPEESPSASLAICTENYIPLASSFHSQATNEIPTS